MPPERKGTEAITQSAFEICEEIIKDNISYDILVQDRQLDRDRLDELVKARFMKLDSEHICRLIVILV